MDFKTYKDDTLKFKDDFDNFGHWSRNAIFDTIYTLLSKGENLFLLSFMGHDRLKKILNLKSKLIFVLKPIFYILGFLQHVHFVSDVIYKERKKIDVFEENALAPIYSVS